MIYKQVSLIFLLDYSIVVYALRIILNFVTLTIVLWTSIVVWMKKRNETLRLLDASRNRRKFNMTKYSDLPNLILLKSLYPLFSRLFTIIRIAVLFLQAIVTLSINCSYILNYTLQNSHHADGIFPWLCEWNCLWILDYSEYGVILSHLNGVWILLFVLSGPVFPKRATETLVLSKKFHMTLLYF